MKTTKAAGHLPDPDKTTKAKRYKADPAAISRHLVAQGWVKSKSLATSVKGYRTRTCGFSTFLAKDGSVWVECEGAVSNDDADRRLREILPALVKRFGVRRVTIIAIGWGDVIRVAP